MSTPNHVETEQDSGQRAQEREAKRERQNWCSQWRRWAISEHEPNDRVGAHTHAHLKGHVVVETRGEMEARIRKLEADLRCALEAKDSSDLLRASVRDQCAHHLRQLDAVVQQRNEAEASEYEHRAQIKGIEAELRTQQGRSDDQVYDLTLEKDNAQAALKNEREAHEITRKQLTAAKNSTLASHPDGPG